MFNRLRNALSLLLLVTATAYCQDRVPFDITGDALSDIGVVQIGSDGSLTWNSISPRTGNSSELASFGERGNHLAPGPWTSAASNDLVVVAKTGKKVFWQLLTDTSQVVSKEFGSGSVAVMGGADLNGNGTLDAVVVSRNKKRLVWNIAYDIFATTPGAVVTETFGRVGDKAFFFNQDGSTDVIAIITKKKTRTRRTRRTLRNTRRNRNKQRYALQTKNLITGATSNSRIGRVAFRFGVVALENTAGNDTLFFHKGKRYVAYDASGSKVTAGRFAAKPKTIIVGDFLPTGGFEVGFNRRGSDNVTVFSLIDGSSQTIPGVSGVVFDEYNINEFGLNIDGSASGASASSGGAGLGKVCPKGSRGYSTGALWKPESDLCHGKGSVGCAAAADPRHGRPVVLLNGGFKNGKGALEVYDAKGNTICKFTEKPNTNGINKGSDHYFSGWAGGCAKSGSEIAAIARKNTGNPNVYLEWKGGQCLGPVNPAGRHGGI